jgi:hypothetical protein
MTVEDVMIDHDGRPYLVLRKLPPEEFERYIRGKLTMLDEPEDTHTIVLDLTGSQRNIVEFDV